MGRAMSIKEEQQTVRSLYATGLTIHEIAAQVGRSAGWVYARLSDKYAPKRRRDTADIVPEVVEGAPESEELAKELERVRAMRVRGKTYEQIAHELGRSLYWVHSRLKGRYRPRGVRTERRFQEEAVVPWLRSSGHEIVSQCQRFTYGQFVLEADVVSMCERETWITEVKVASNGHELHTAIGQLVLHRCLSEPDPAPHLQIVLPASARSERMAETLLRALAARESIKVAFVPWTGTGNDAR